MILRMKIHAQDRCCIGSRMSATSSIRSRRMVRRLSAGHALGGPGESADFSPRASPTERSATRALVSSGAMSAKWSVKMKQKLALIVGVALLGATSMTTAPEVAAAPTISRGHCIGTLPEISFGGTIAPQREEEVFSWSTTCTSSAYASASGGVLVSIQERVPGGWRVRSTGGYAHIPDVGPGTYRIVVKSTSASSTAYTVRHRRGIG